jgi:dynein heavy chain, axonemal
MKHNVEVLQRMTDHLDGASRELDAINREQALLDFEETNFPLLQAMFQAKDPYSKLWTTALNFTVKSEEWMNGTYSPH